MSELSYERDLRYEREFSYERKVVRYEEFVG